MSTKIVDGVAVELTAQEEARKSADEAAAIAKVKELLTGFGIIWSDADVIDP